MSRRTKEIYEFGPFSLDAIKRILRRDGKRVKVTAKLFDLLLKLVRVRYAEPERVVGKDEMLQDTWPRRFDPDIKSEIYSQSFYRLLTNCICRLRRALKDDSDAPVYIETIPGVGYRLIPDVIKSVEPDRKPVIAVLPFKLIGGQQEGDEYLGVGIACAVITQLGTIDEIIIRPWSAILKYDKLNIDPLQFAHEQGADMVVVGLIQRDGEDIRVDVEIISKDDGEMAWSKEYPERLTSGLAVQEVIAKKMVEDMAESFRWKLASLDLDRKDDTNSTEAYQWYVKGRYYSNKFKGADFKKAIECFEQAIKCDPGYAKAYAAIADCYIWLAVYNLRPAQEALSTAERWAYEALERDNQLAGAHTSLAFIGLCTKWDWAGAERGFLRAIRFNSNHTKSRLFYALSLAGQERFDAALAEIDRALEIYSVSLIINVVRAIILYLDRRYEESIDQLFETLEIDPNFDGAYHCQALAYVQLARKNKEMFKKAIEAAQSAINRAHNNPLNKALLSYVYAMAGEAKKADQLLDELKKLRKPHYVSPFYIALIYGAKGESDAAFKWMEKAWENRDPWLVLLKSEPRVDALRKDPRFKDILKRIGLTMAEDSE
jgi:DNA-binding winged helix-turn-helix (wHTH) protein/tetratricopeptide (TPR) repeat protein